MHYYTLTTSISLLTLQQLMHYYTLTTLLKGHTNTHASGIYINAHSASMDEASDCFGRQSYDSHLLCISYIKQWCFFRNLVKSQHLFFTVLTLTIIFKIMWCNIFQISWFLQSKNSSGPWPKLVVVVKKCFPRWEDSLLARSWR